MTTAELRKLKPYTITEVVWEDAWFQEGDNTIEAASDVRACVRHSCGYIVRADREYIILAMTDDRKAVEDSTMRRKKPVGDILTIPTKYAQSVRVVEKAVRR